MSALLSTLALTTSRNRHQSAVVSLLVLAYWVGITIAGSVFRIAVSSMAANGQWANC